MKTMDYLKAMGVGFLAAVLNLAVSVPVILAWRYLVIPGRPESAYKDLPLQIAPWSSHVAGPLIFVVLIWLFSRRRPRRNAWIFAVSVWATYAILDLAVAFLATGPAASTSPILLASLIAKLGAALAGAWLTTRRSALVP